jgi:hypothetical protein
MKTPQHRVFPKIGCHRLLSKSRCPYPWNIELSSPGLFQSSYIFFVAVGRDFNVSAAGFGGYPGDGCPEILGGYNDINGVAGNRDNFGANFPNKFQGTNIAKTYRESGRIES